ncbi:uncharacterized protein LOC122948034 [Acropora millepora]|uniref:uncharacterized protein LOC122948034 n=1 Tax=Acropora millepora TaxID=45264 RepID=UPI001CF4A920|nr:uncharacterized protein LOC122948034 [Acropora millepora]
MRCKTMLSFHSKTGAQELHAVLIVALLFTAIIIRGCVCDGCRTLIFHPPMNDRYLYGHVYRSYVIESKADCEHKCYLDADCMSTNTKILHTGKFLCELSDSDHKLHPEDLKFGQNFTYTATENFCVTHSCSLHGRCQTGFTNKGYRCVCSTGFTGQFCKIGVGQKPASPGKSCKHLLDSGFSLGDGEYWINPGSFGKSLKVTCDMTTDGGGWLLVSSIVAKNDHTVKAFLTISGWKSSKHKSNKRFITISALKELRKHLPFTQLRFHCSKKLGRTFHVATVANNSGEAVIQYFTNLTDVLPESCGSFERMSDDNSTLSVSCGEWGFNQTAHIGKWGHVTRRGEYRLNNRPAFIEGKGQWNINSLDQSCDDKGDETAVSPGDFWKIYVR